MTGNRSLDEFVPGDDPDGASADPPEPPARRQPGSDTTPVAPGPAEPAGTSEGDGPDGGATVEDAPSVEPLAETFAWSASGGTCARCDEPAQARWRDGQELVCVDCKVW